MHILHHKAKPETSQATPRLLGKSFLLTQPEAQAGELEIVLKTHGGHVILCPTIQIVANQCSTDVGLKDDKKYPFDWIIFTSKNTVRFFFAQLKTNGLDIEKIRHCKICAVGPQTAELVESYGVNVHLVPQQYTAEGIVEEFDKQSTKSLRFLYPRGDKARNVINQSLSARGNVVYSPILYRTLPPDELPEPALNALSQRMVHCAIFTAPSMVEHLAQILGKAEFSRLLKGVVIASIGPITSQACLQYGLTVHIEAKTYTLASLADEILEKDSHKAEIFSCYEGK